MKSLQDYIAEGIFNNIGAGEWEIEEGEIREWLEKSRLRVNFDDLITKGYNNSPHPLIKSDAITPGVHGHIEITNRPELFPDHCWPEFIRFASAPECGLEVSGCGLETLRNMPKVYRYLNVSNNNIKSLEEYGYREIDDYVSRGSAFNVSNNDLHSLKGCPACSTIRIHHNPHLRSLKGIPSSRMLENLDARNCDLLDLNFIPKMQKYVDSLILCNNPNLDYGDGLKTLLKNTSDIRSLAIDVCGIESLISSYQGSIKYIYICNIPGDDFLESKNLQEFIHKFSPRRGGLLEINLEGAVSDQNIREMSLYLKKSGVNCGIRKSIFYSALSHSGNPCS